MYDKSLTTAKENLPVWKEIAGRSLRIELYFWMFVMTGEHIFKSVPALGPRTQCGCNLQRTKNFSFPSNRNCKWHRLLCFQIYWKQVRDKLKYTFLLQWKIHLVSIRWISSDTACDVTVTLNEHPKTILVLYWSKRTFKNNPGPALI